MFWRTYAFAATTALVIAAPATAQADFGGVYIGSHVGGNFPSIEVEGEFDNGVPTTYELEPDGWTAGIHAGYNLP